MMEVGQGGGSRGRILFHLPLPYWRYVPDQSDPIIFFGKPQNTPPANLENTQIWCLGRVRYPVSYVTER